VYLDELGMLGSIEFAQYFERLGFFYPLQRRNFAVKPRFRQFERIETVRMFVARCVTATYICVLYTVLPMLPVVATLVFHNWFFILKYRHTLRKALVHFLALRRGPVPHFFTISWAELKGSH
jgi:hypothetical protein